MRQIVTAALEDMRFAARRHGNTTVPADINLLGRLAIRPFKSSNVVSLSGWLGGASPLRRAAPILATSAAFCTWRAKLNMSGANRASFIVVGSIPFATAWAAALSKILDRFATYGKLL
jgi:hypothetical protein